MSNRFFKIKMGKPKKVVFQDFFGLKAKCLEQIFCCDLFIAS